MPTEQPILRCPRTDIDGTTPFDNDLLNRKDLALKLTGYIDRLNEGAVLAIDAPWGEGKTWFGKNWKQYLESNDRKVIYIDAFAQDYIEDPFMLLASELLAIVEEKTKTKTQLAKKSVAVLQATMSIGTKIGAGLATTYLLGGVELGDEVEKAISNASGETALLTSKLIEESFERFEDNKQTLDAYKNELASYASAQEKPVVIFIDELDRCKPDFAVRLIERIKHFFDVPNIVFVLLINREQLESAIKGVYGSDTDASAYLGKFINFFFKLPKSTFEDYHSHRLVEGYVKETFKKYKFQGNVSNTVQLVSILSNAFDLSLRDIEKIVALYAFAYPVRIYSEILIYVIVLKQKNYTNFKRLLNGDKSSHEEMINVLDEIIQIEERRGAKNRIFDFAKAWHEAYVADLDDAAIFNDDTGDIIGKQIRNMYLTLSNIDDNLSFKQTFAYFSNLIDLSIEN